MADGTIGTTDRVARTMSADDIKKLEENLEQSAPGASGERVRSGGLGSGGHGSVDEHSGSFSYRVPVRIPPPILGGPVPKVGVTYNSMSSATPTAVAAGWRLEIGFIERTVAEPDVQSFVDFRNNQTEPGHNDVFEIAIDGISGTLVPKKDDPGVFRCKIEATYLEARPVFTDVLDPDIENPSPNDKIISHWIVTLGNGLRYTFGKPLTDPANQRGGEAVITNKRWWLVEIDSALGHKSQISYEAFADENNPEWDEAPYSYPKVIRTGVSRDGKTWDGEIHFHYRDDDSPSGTDGYGELGAAFVGRRSGGPFSEFNCIIWRRLVAVSSHIVRPNRKLERIARLKIDAELVAGRFAVRSINTELYRNGHHDPSADLPPHRFEYQTDFDPANPMLMTLATGQLGAATRLTYVRADDPDVDEEALHMTGRVLVSRSVLESAEGESWGTTFTYIGGTFFTPSQEYRGHRIVRKLDEATGTITETEFEQNGVHNGHVRRTEQYDRAEKLVEKTTRDWMALDYDGGRMAPFIARTITKSFAEDGKTILKTVVDTIPLRDPSDPSKGFMVDDFCCAERREVALYAGPESGTPLRESITETVYDHPVHDGRIFVGLIKSSKSHARLNGKGPFKLTEAYVNTHDNRGLLVHGTMQVLDEPKSPVYSKFRDYDADGRLLAEYRGDGVLKQLLLRRTYYRDGPLAGLLESEFDLEDNGEHYLEYDMRFRMPTLVEFDNGRQLRNEFDGRGRAILEAYQGASRDRGSRSRGTETSVTHAYAVTGSGRSITTTNIHTGSVAVTLQDSLERVFESRKSGPHGDDVIQTTEFDYATRQPKKVSEPYFEADGPKGFTLTDYNDPRQRVSQTTSPAGLVTTMTYHGLVTRTCETIKAPDGSTRRRHKEMEADARGLTVRHRDEGPDAFEVTYVYDHEDRLTKVSDNLGHVLERTDYGSRIDDKPVKTWNVSRGTTKLTYDGLGRIETAEQDFHRSLDRLCTMTFDDRDRMTRQIDLDRTTGAERIIEQSYDTAPNGVGQLAWRKVTDKSGLGTYSKEEHYTYDPFGLPSDVRHVWAVDLEAYGVKTGLDLSMQYQHNGDKGGRVETVVYPALYGAGERTARYHYHDQTGLLTDIVYDGNTVWSGSRFNSRGSVTKVALGDAMSARYGHDLATGRLEQISFNGPEKPLAEHRVIYDSVGAVVEREVSVPAAPLENGSFGGTYGYDNRNQLLKVTEDGLKQAFTYGPDGTRLTTVDNDKSYEHRYECESPHQVSEITGSIQRKLDYDRAGNLIRDVEGDSGRQRLLDWNPSNKLARLRIEGAGSADYFYGYAAGDEQCFALDANARTLTFHVADKMDVTLNIDDGTYKVSRHISNGARRVMSDHAFTDGGEDQQLFYLRDHLKTVGLVADAKANVFYAARMSPFGQVLEETGIRPDILFTGHRTDHLEKDSFSQYSANARRYDPVLCVFLSPDPNHDAEGAAFGYNLYCYVGNNPLSLFDPTGLEAKGLVVVAGDQVIEELRGTMSGGSNLTGGDVISRLRERVFTNDNIEVISESQFSNLGGNINGRNLAFLDHGSQVTDMIGNHNANILTAMRGGDNVFYNLGCRGSAADITDGGIIHTTFLNKKYVGTESVVTLLTDNESGSLAQRYTYQGMLNESINPRDFVTINQERMVEGATDIFEENKRIGVSRRDRPSMDLLKNSTQTNLDTPTNPSHKGAAKKMLSKAGGSLLKSVNVFGAISEAGELADNIRKGDVEASGKQIGTMVAGRVPGGDLAFEAGYAVGDAINKATDNFVPNLIADGMCKLGVHKAIAKVADWFGWW